MVDIDIYWFQMCPCWENNSFIIPVGLLLRLSGGEPMLGLPATFHYPMFDYVDGVPQQFFPFKSMSMAACLATIIGVR